MPGDEIASTIPVLKPGVDLAKPSEEQPAADEAARRLYEESLPAVVQIRTNKGSGTGFFFNEAGQIITAAHVVQGSNEHFAITKDGTKYRLMIERMDDINDVAILRPIGMPAGAKPFLELARDSKLKPDQPLFAIGHPEGLRPAYLSPGNFRFNSTPLQLVREIAPNSLANVRKRIGNWTPKELTDLKEFIERPLVHSALHIRHGNSGGPLLDADRKTVGISDMINPDNPSESYFVPVEKIHDLLKPNNEKFSFTYTRMPEQWTQDYVSRWSNKPALAVLETSAAAAVGYGGYRLLSRLPVLGAAAAGAYGAGALTTDATSLLNATDSVDRLKYGLSALADLTTMAGAVATVFPRTRPFGMAAVGVGVIGRTATDFVRNRLILTDINRKNGEPRLLFDSPL